MNCPVCDAKLRQVNKHGVEVDICPDCKGVWLDRGELDKIIQMVSEGVGSDYVDRDAAEERPREYREQPRQRVDERDYERERHHEDQHSHSDKGDPKYTNKRKRESLLGNIMDMFGGGGDD